MTLLSFSRAAGVWDLFGLASDDVVCGVVCVAIAISTFMGAVVAKLDDVSVKANDCGVGIGTALLEQLKSNSEKICDAIDVGVHLGESGGAQFYERPRLRGVE